MNFVEYSQLLNQKAELETELRKVKKKLSDGEPKVLDLFTEQGIESARVASEGRTLHVRRMVAARMVNGDRDAIARGLEKAGLAEELLKNDFNMNRVSAYFRERVDNGEAIEDVVPPELADHLEVYEFFRIGHATTAR